MPTTHTLEPELRTLHGYLSRELAPILTIDPGDSVVYKTLEAGWHVAPRPAANAARERASPATTGT